MMKPESQERDNKTDYEVLRDNINNLPMTWYPALIHVMVRSFSFRRVNREKNWKG